MMGVPDTVLPTVVMAAAAAGAAAAAPRQARINMQPFAGLFMLLRAALEPQCVLLAAIENGQQQQQQGGEADPALPGLMGMHAVVEPVADLFGLLLRLVAALIPRKSPQPVDVMFKGAGDQHRCCKGGGC